MQRGGIVSARENFISRALIIPPATQAIEITGDVIFDLVAPSTLKEVEYIREYFPAQKLPSLLYISRNIYFQVQSVFPLLSNCKSESSV